MGTWGVNMEWSSLGTQEILYTAFLLLGVVNAVFAVCVKIGENVLHRTCKPCDRNVTSSVCDSQILKYLLHLSLLCLMVVHVLSAADIHNQVARTWLERVQGETESAEMKKTDSNVVDIEFDDNKNMMRAIEMSACFVITGICSIYFWIHYILVKLQRSPYLAFIAVVFSPPFLLMVGLRS